MATTRERKGINLYAEYMDKLKELADMNRRSLTAQLELLIDEAAVDSGIEPVTEPPFTPAQRKRVLA